MKHLLALAAGLFLATSASAQVQTTGVGTVTAKRDCVHLYLSVVNDSTDLSAAHNANRTSTDSLFTALNTFKIAEGDRTTTNYSFSPIYDQKNSEFRGFQVAHSIMVRIRNLSEVGKVIDSAAKVQGIRVDGIQFEFSNRLALENQARDLALADARRKAEQMCKGVGVTLGFATTLSESSSYYPRNGRMYTESARMDRVADTQVAAGDGTVTVNVSVTWDINKRVATPLNQIERPLIKD